MLFPSLRSLAGLAITFFFFLIHIFSAQSQIQNTVVRDTSGKKLINIIYSDYLEFIDTNQNNPIRRLVGKVQLEHSGSTFYCDSTDLFLKQNKIKAYHNINIKHRDGTNIWSNWLDYDGNSKEAVLRENVKLTKEAASLETSVLSYNTSTRIAHFNNNGILKKDSTTVTSKSGTYNAQNEDAEFFGNVIIQNPSYNIKSEKIRYNTKTNIATFLAPTYIKRGNSTVYCEDGWYNTSTEEGFFKKNAKVNDPPNVLQGDEIYYNAKTKQGKIKGNVNIIDSIKQTQLVTKDLTYDAATKTYTAIDSVQYTDYKKQIFASGNKMVFSDSTKFMQIEGNGIIDARKDKTKVWGDNIRYNDSLKTFLASKNAYLAIEIEKDTLWIVADTLDYVGNKTSDSISLNGIFKAFHHVKIYKQDFQGLCDSLFYTSKDSTFTFYKKPIFWSDNTQFTADTIQMRLKNKKPDVVNLLENAFIISKTDTAMLFQQIKGRKSNIYFKDSKLNLMYVNGNSETIYYAQDDKKGFIGVNKAVASRMRITFKDKNAVDKIIMIGSPESDFIPIKQALTENMTLKGFSWQIEKRPNTKWDILPRK